MPDLQRGWGGSFRLIDGPFRTLLLGQSAGQFGDGLAQIAFAQLVVFDVGKGVSPGRIAAVFAATLLPFCLVGPVAGVFIDRWDRRRTLILASAFRCCLAAVAVATAIWRVEVLAYLGILLLLSSSRFVLDAKGAVLPGLVQPADLVRANAISALLGSGAAFVGAVGGTAFVSWSVVAGFLAAAASYLLASSCFARLPSSAGHERDRRRVRAALGQVGLEVGAAARAIVTTQRLRRPLAGVCAHRVLLGAGFVLLVLVADRRFHVTTSGYGTAIAVTGVATVIGTLGAPWLASRWSPETLLALAFLPPASAIAVCGYAPTLVGLIAALAVTAVSFQVLKVLADATVGGAARDAIRGRVFSLYDVLYNVAFVLAGLAMIPLWRLDRERALLWWLAAAFALGWLVMAGTARQWPFERRRPASVGRRARWAVRVCAALSGGIVVVSFPAPSLWWTAWFSLVPGLILIRRAPDQREAAIRAWCVAVGFLLAVHYWLFPSLTLFLPLVVAALALLWMPWGVLVWRVLSGRPSPVTLAASLVVLPAGWVMIEAIRSWSALGGPWGLLGASQWNRPQLLAPASAGGVWLVSFLVVAVNVALTVLIESDGLRTRGVAAAVALGLLAAGPVWFLMERAPSGTSTLRVAMIQAGVVHGAQQRLDDELAATNELPAGQFNLVVWGESSVGFDLLSRPDLLRQLEQAASRLQADLLVNVDAAGSGGAIRKTAVLLGPDGIISTYQKMRLVPFGEYIPLRPLLGWLTGFTKAAAVNRQRGSRLVVMRADGVALSPLICFESAFPDLGRAAARQGAQVIVYQSATTTFQGTWAPEQQAALGAVRAVETGRPVINATLAGTTAVYDPQGHRVVWLESARGTSSVVLRLSMSNTLFDRYGDWVLAWSLVLLAGFAIATSLRSEPEPPPAPRSPNLARRPCPVPEPAQRS